MDLTGLWRAAPAEEGLRRAFPEPGFDDGGWDRLDVPGHWRSHPAFAGHDGGVLYRRAFADSTPGPGERAWLVLDGLFYQGDVWLDGSYVGDTEGYFFPHAFEVTTALAGRAEHVLAVEVSCHRQGDRKAKRNITGVFQHWDCHDPDWNPGGIWRPVRIERSGPVRLSRLRALCSEATPERARVRLRAVLDAVEPRTVVLRTRIGGSEHRFERPLAAGENTVEWNVAIEQPDLWWPHQLGDQPLDDLTVEVLLPQDTLGEEVVSDLRTVRIGLRQVRMSSWITTVNGERLFLKGANVGPARMALAEATGAEIGADVALARDAGLDLLRVHGHISRPELYDAADRLGMLLWQDMPLQWGYARGIRKQAARQATEAVDLLGHHPSIALWCGHNEPLALDIEPGDARARSGRYFAQQQLPTWNKTVLDASVRRALERADGTRPVVAHSGVLPHPGSGGTDSHLYLGWYRGDERDLPALCARFPRLARFVSEFGAQAIPNTDQFLLDAGADTAWPDLDWETLGRRHGLQRAVFERVGLDPATFPDYPSWKAATQRYQANLLTSHVEHLRRLKYRPTGGFCQFLLADAHPGVTWSVLDHERHPKPGYAALAAACAPVIIVADRPAATYRPGDPLALDVHVVSDLRQPLDEMVATATLAWAGGGYEWRWTGSVPADACVRVATIQAIVPDVPGPLTLDLSLAAGPVQATNRYESHIAPLGGPTVAVRP